MSPKFELTCGDSGTNTFLLLLVLTGGLILTANHAHAVDIGFSGFGTVAAGKVAAARGQPERHLADRGSVLDEPLQQRDILRRVDLVQPAGEDSDRARGEAGFMGGGVYAACQTRDHDETRLPEIAGEPGAEDRSADAMDGSRRAEAADGRSPAPRPCQGVSIVGFDVGMV